MSGTGAPSNDTMASPVLSPAAAAGESPITDSTRTFDQLLRAGRQFSATCGRPKI